MRLLIALALIWVPAVGLAQQGWQIGPPELPLYIIAQNGGSTPCTVDFEDFIAFAQAFNSTKGDPNFNPSADTNQDGVVNFPDFIAFAGVFGLARAGDDCQRSIRSHIRVTGHVVTLGKPFANVWVDAVRVDSEQAVTWEKTDTLGAFSHVSLSRGTYAFVPKQFGYIFSPDTVKTVVADSSLSLPMIKAHLAFGLVDVKVVRDSLPVSDVKVSFLRSVAGQKASGPWVGITDPSGVSAVRIPVLEGQTDITGTYFASVVDTITGTVLDTWSSVPIQTGDTRRLVLDIGHDASYVPGREYVFNFEDQQKVSVAISDERLRIWFREDVDENAKVALLNRLGLEENEDHFFTLMHARGRLAVLETMHQLRRSGLIESVTPEFDAGRFFEHRSNHLIVAFNDDVVDTDIEQFIKNIGGSVVKTSSEIYEVEILDLLSQDIFEVSEKYRNHPWVKHMRPHFDGVAAVWLVGPG